MVKIHRESDMSKAYPSNDTQQFELLNDLIQAPKSGGRPREVDMWEILNAITSSVRDAVGGRRLSLADGVHLFPQLA